MNKSVCICGVNTATLPKINATECEKLLVAVKRGDKGAKDKLVMANVRLVLSVIKRFNNSGVSSDDMFQVGCVGLIKAADNFDLSVGVKFSTYAVPMIIGEIKRFLRSKNSMRVSRSIRDTAYKALKMRCEIERDNQEATVCEIARRLDVAESEVAYALDAISDTVSLYDPVFNKQGDTLMIVDQLADEFNTDERWSESVALNNAIKDLDEREQKILYSRYYLGKTQTEISSEVGLSQAQVSRIEKTALKTIKAKIS
ncbi:MAG: sigma-70 family RNA polymerase sigma factor [Clostridia bacterium]|nr:sigma-70 family RNA polymerase sigma factor [Clostridia bacterium]MBQ6883947.1 sigma-70 family RNA polymerase sigma factor [Clostridia bacterium]MBR2933425.1 sigma-70 family RNA polymerase sigma factor [Clostridia bacterium]MBR6687817.1 sigma-70 family RNA polymerase sigma factor [Clostridia bacterium]